MKSRWTFSAVALVALVGLMLTGVRADEKAGKAKDSKTEKVRLYLDGAFCMGCSSVLTEALAFGGVKNHSKISPNGGRGYVIVLGEFGHDTDLGRLAKAVNAAETPHRSKAQPGVALELFAKLDKASAAKAIAALGKIEGVDAEHSKAIVKRGVLSVKLDGGAKLTVNDLVAGLKNAGVDAHVVTEGKQKPAKKSGEGKSEKTEK